MSTNHKLLFVYNADSGLFSQLTDYAHKIISPNTYACNLCKLTYGNLGIKKGWKEFLNSLRAEKEFLHRNEFTSRYPEFADIHLPAVFFLNQGSLTLLLSANVINDVKNLDELRNLLNGKINKL